jgi:hypothetical protein
MTLFLTTMKTGPRTPPHAPISVTWLGIDITQPSGQLRGEIEMAIALDEHIPAKPGGR